MMANAYAAELLIARNAGKVTVTDPLMAADEDPVRPLQMAVYVVRAPDAYSAVRIDTGRILRVRKRIDDNVLELEIA